MKIKEAEAITHTLSKPGKMPGFAYSTPAHECKTGTKLRAVPNSVCSNCYAYERGRYRFQNVKNPLGASQCSLNIIIHSCQLAQRLNEALTIANKGCDHPHSR